MNELKHTDQVSAGVEELIARLQQDGVEAGRQQAEKTISEAQLEADRLLQEAERKAQKIVSDAKEEAEKIRQGGEEALAIALRDIVLKLKAKLMESVGKKVQLLIANQLDQQQFLQQLIVEVVGRARRQAKLDDQSQVTVLLPEKLVGLDELRQKPLELKEGTLSHFIINVAADVLRDGVQFKSSSDLSSGLSIYLKEQDSQIDLTDESLTQVLLEHLQPRFRAILEGMVK